MFTQYFGSYLFESGLLTVDQYKSALREIPGKRARLGVLAIESGYMTPDQVEKTHTMQMQADKRFGELAVECGYLGKKQLEELLQRQTSAFSAFSQVMMDHNWVTYTQLSDLLEQYREHCGMDEETFRRFQRDDMELLIERAVKPHVHSEAEWEVALPYIEIFTKNVMRFIDDNVRLGDPGALPQLDETWHVCQKISGRPTFTTMFNGRDEDMLFFSRRFSNMQIREMDDLGRDVLGEFLNCSNGIFIANMMDSHVDFDLDPQYTVRKITESGDRALHIPFLIDDTTYLLHLLF